MRALILLVLFVSTLAVMASEEVSKEDTNTASGEPKGYQFGAYDVFKPRPARWQTRMAPSGWMGPAPGPLRPAIVENDPEYYPKLINWLDKVGRRR